MNRYYIILFFFKVGLLSASALQAQERPSTLSPDTLAVQEALYLQQKLALNDAQVAQVTVVARNFHIDFQDLRKAGFDSSKWQKELELVHTAHQQSLKRILTTAQWAAYEKGVVDRRATFLQRTKEKKISVKGLSQ